MADRLNNKYKTKAVWYNDCREYQEEALTYVLRQSQTIRTVEIDEISYNPGGGTRSIGYAIRPMMWISLDE